jgi:hypothetical protein
MGFDDWRKSMGVMDLPNVTYFSRQIFEAINFHGDGKVLFEDY